MKGTWMPYLTWRKAASTVLCASALTVGSLAAATAAQAASQRIPVANTHPSCATAAHRVGASQLTSGTVSSRVYLAPNDAAGLASVAAEVSTPGSAPYRHFLTPKQVQARFGTTTAQLDAVKNWLTQSGLRVTGVSNHVAGGYVAVSGSVAAASRGFSVSFDNCPLGGHGAGRG